jgi:acyl-CoA-binding protein
VASFEDTATAVKSGQIQLPSLSQQDMLQLYGLYKQATEASFPDRVHPWVSWVDPSGSYTFRLQSLYICCLSNTITSLACRDHAQRAPHQYCN